MAWLNSQSFEKHKTYEKYGNTKFALLARCFTPPESKSLYAVKHVEHIGVVTSAGSQAATYR